MRNSHGERTDAFFKRVSKLTVNSLHNHYQHKADKGQHCGNLEVEHHCLIDAETTSDCAQQGNGEEHQDQALDHEQEAGEDNWHPGMDGDCSSNGSSWWRFIPSVRHQLRFSETDVTATDSAFEKFFNTAWNTNPFHRE